MIHVTKSSGVVAEFGGKYWGVQYDDGHSRSEGFGPVEKASVRDPLYCLKPTDMTWDPKNFPNPYFEELERATLRPIEIETKYTVIHNG